MDVEPSHIDFLSTLRKIPGLGPKRLCALSAVGIKTVGDLLRYYPIKYIDRSKTVAVCEVRDYVDGIVTVRGVVAKVGREHFGKQRFRVTVKDESGETIDAIWYMPTMKITPEEELVITGKVLSYRNKFFMVHPLLEKVTGSGDIKPIVAVYSMKEQMRDAKISQSQIRKSIEWALSNICDFPQILPAAIESKHDFPPLCECLRYVHAPDDLSTLERYKSRLKYEELYNLALNLRWNKKKFALKGYAMVPGKLDANMRAILPFKLTDSQEQAVKILYDDAAKPLRMHRLMQGDVGSGKTIVALMAALPALNSGYQVAWMAPTEILAKQTFAVVQKYVEKLGFKVGYLGAGDLPEKRATLQDMVLGRLNFVVGTHALFMPSVRFHKLGMVIIDEQHKFGAAQRLNLQEKGTLCDFLMMSATPIPQTMAQTLYGDLDLVEIGSRPDRASVSTHIVPPRKRTDMENFILEQITAGYRAFVVAPRIDQQGDGYVDDVGDGVTARNSIKTVDIIAKKLELGPLSAVPIHRLHGRMSYHEREEAIDAFRDGPPGVLVATAIVEVGVDILDATVMVIENPEFFGVAQLHQIRGRVGRGGIPSYCFLLPGGGVDKNEHTVERLNFLCGTHNGFEIAEWDLRKRGPGETAGFRQSGWDDLYAADILEDADMFRDILKETAGLFIE